MSTKPEAEKSLTTTTELAEAFSLGSVLARIETGQSGITKTVDKIDGTVTGMSERLGVVEVTLGRQGEQIVTAFNRIAALETKPTPPAPDVPSRTEFNEVKAEVKDGRLSWGKITALLGGLLALTGLLVFADRIIPG